MTATGDPAAGATERLIQLLFVLTRSGGRAPAAELLRIAGYGAEEPDGRRRQLARDIDQLRRAGWDIRNEAGPGEDARFRLVASDLRLRVRFAPDEQAELQRVARVAGSPRLTRLVAGASGTGADPGGDGAGAADQAVVSVPTDPGPLDLVLHAVENRCLLRFRYKGSDRVVHPLSVHPRVTGWYLRAREDDRAGGAAEAKLFRLDRMAAVEADEPGSAPAPRGGERTRVSVDPVTWQVDPPVVAEVAAPPEHVPHAEDLLGAARARRAADDGSVVLEIPVTHRAAFRSRLYELGTRVRLLGPADLREEVRADLTAVLHGRP